MEKLITLFLILIIFSSCTEKSPEVVGEEYTPSFQVNEGDAENGHLQNDPLPITNNRNQQEFNAYEYSKTIKKRVQENDFSFAYTYEEGASAVLEFFTFAAFSMEDLRLLRSRFESDISGPYIQNGLSERWFSKDRINATYGYNINMLKAIENNYPEANEMTKNLTGLWCLAYHLPDQGYVTGDYLVLYDNGIFEYINRNFQGRRGQGNKIFGGSRFGLWSTDTQ